MRLEAGGLRRGRTKPAEVSRVYHPGIFRPLIGADGRFPTSLTQVGLWTLLIVTAMAFFIGRFMFEGVEIAEVLPQDTWSDYLILLSGPFAAAALAKGVTTYNVAAGTLQKSEPPAPSVTQLATNDYGSADLVDTQYLLFNVVAMGYSLIAVFKSPVLPRSQRCCWR